MRNLKLSAGLFVALLFSVSMLTASEKFPANTFSQMPENVKAVIDKSCFSCHNTESRNADAKEKLDFIALDSLSTARKLAALRHIGEVVEKSEMPPKQFLERFPDRKLTEDEAKVLTEWVKSETASILGR
jgi:uncharacterized membrane protein